MLSRSSASAQQPMAEPAEVDDQSASLSAADSQAPAWPRRPALAQAVPSQDDTAWDDPAEARTAGEAGTAAGQPVSGGRSHMTARGAVVAMFGLFLAADLTASWTGHEVPAGLGFLAACILGPYLVRRHALLQVLAASPAIFLVALVITQIATAQGTGKHGKILSVLEGTVLVLAALAPWLLSGTAIGIAVAIPRGLVQCTRELKRELREDLAQRRPWTARTRG